MVVRMFMLEALLGFYQPEPGKTLSDIIGTLQYN